jgi:ribosomal protein S12 methylthiotransferase
MENTAVKKPSVYFVSLGCPKNLVDSQVMLGKLEGAKYEIATAPDHADVIIVNTCSFIQAAKEESIDTVLEMAQYKETGNCKALVMSGCLPQRYAKEIEKEMPEVDLMIGTGQYHKITELLASHADALKMGAPLPKRAYIDFPAFIHSEKDERMHTGPQYTGYLKLSEGCNRRCAFCIIPTLRGNVRSRTIASLVEEATHMAANGVRELNLVAQDLTEYGMEWKYKENLEMLLPQLCKIEGVEWIRLHYVYPDQFSDELVEIIAREPKIVKYLDMPIQHTADRVLKVMNRRLTKAKLYDLIAKLRAQIPELVLRSSIIVGFPTETDEEFDELVHDLTALNLDHVGVFSFSKEEGTKAAEMDGQLHPGVKRKRKKKLISVLQEQRTDKLTALIGSRVTVMVEGPAPESELLIQARMASQAQEIDGRVIINDLGALYDQAIGAGESVLQPGDFVTVEITELAQQDLVAKLISIDLPMKKPTTEGTAPGLNTIQKGIEHRHDERTAQ